MTKTIRLTMAQALTRYMMRQMTEIGAPMPPLISSVPAMSNNFGGIM